MRLSLLVVLAFIACDPGRQVSGSRYLYVWAGDADSKDSDFLAVVDAREGTAGYGQVISSTPVNAQMTWTHHMEYQMPDSGRLLFVNGHHAERVFLFNTDIAEKPTLVRSLAPPPKLRYPHDMVRLPNGNLLIGYLRGEGRTLIAGDSTLPGWHGGIAEVDSVGTVLRTASAADTTVAVPIRPYSFVMLPALDRFLVTSAPMMEDTTADVIQIWQYSDLRLLRTVQVPPAKLPDGRVRSKGHQYPFEPRLMPDGSVLFNSYGCGFYRVTSIDEDRPAIENVYTIDIPEPTMGSCGVPALVTTYWIMAVGALHALVCLDISDPAKPREVGRLVAADTAFRPHWLAKDPLGERIVVGSEDGSETKLLMAKINSRTCALRWDDTFRSAPDHLGFSFRRASWPHGETGDAYGHAALFRR